MRRIGNVKLSKADAPRSGNNLLKMILCCTVLLAALVFVADAPILRAARQSSPNAGYRAQSENTLPGDTVSPAAQTSPFFLPDEITAENDSQAERQITTPVMGASENGSEPATAQNSYTNADTATEDPFAQPSDQGDKAIGQNEADLSYRYEERAQIAVRAQPALAPARTLYIEPTGQYENMLNAASDTIHYEFDVGERGVLYYGLDSEAENSAAWKVRLYQQYYVNGSGGETAYRSLNTLNAAAKNKRNRAPGIGLMPGHYRISVASEGVFTPALFSLCIEFYAGTAYEMEYNDSVTRYTEIYADVPVKGSASLYDDGRDTDWYMIRTYSDCALDLLFTHTSSKQTTVAFKVYLYDADMRELYSGNSLLSDISITSGRVGVPAGTYFIQVQGRVYTESEYTLTVRRDAADFEKEPNDGFAFATPIVPGEALRGALSGRSGNSDRDYYVFTLQNPGYVNVALKNLVLAEKSSGYIRRVRLLDSEGHSLYGALLTDVADGIRSSNIGLGAGTYYISVDNDDLYLNSGTYEIEYSFTASSGWEREYNGTPECATQITDRVNVSGTISDAEALFDEDWYTFSTDDAGTLILRLNHDNLGGGRDIFHVTLYSAAQKQIGDTMVSFESSDTVSARFAVAKGKFYVKVTSGNYKSDVRYYLSYETEK